MIIIKKILIFIIVINLVACATAVTEEASRVMLYNSNTGDFIKDCERLGAVTGEGSGWKPRLSDDSWSGVTEDAKNDLRKNAYEQYKADSVILINVDRKLTSIVAQGIAYRCNQ